VNAVTIRASSLSDLLDCPARWEARHLLDMRMPSSPAALIGTAVHAGATAFDKAKKSADRISPLEAAVVARDYVDHPNDEVDWTGSDVTVNEARNIAGSLAAVYSDVVGEGASYLSIEEQLPNLTIAVNGVDITLTGSVDRLRIDPDQTIGVRDLKTGKNVKGDKHRAQLGVYKALATAAFPDHRITAPEDIVAMGTTRGENSIEVVTLDGDSLAMLVGSPEQPGLLHHVASVIKTEAFFGNPRSQLCSGKYCPRFSTCHWRK